MKTSGPQFRRASFMLLCLGLILHTIDFYWYRIFPLNGYFNAEEQQIIRMSWPVKDTFRMKSSVYNKVIPINMVGAEILIESGLAEKLAERLLRYRSAYGPIDSKEDLTAIYSMDTVWLNQVDSLLDFKKRPVASEKPANSHLNLDTFNPNVISAVELKQMGLSKGVINGIISFREKFRPFENRNDIFRVYQIDSNLGKQLFPFLRIDSILISYEAVDINSADSATLIHLPGFGLKTCKFFLDQRSRLGGFHSKDQLQELFFIDSLWLQRYQKRITVETPVRTININEDSLEKLASHPYIRYKVARNIIDFRERIGLFNSVDELVNIELVDDVLLRKLAPYLRISESDTSASLSQKIKIDDDR